MKEGQVQRQSTEIKSQKTKLAYEWKEVERRVKDIEYRERMLEGRPVCEQLILCAFKSSCSSLENYPHK